MEAARIYQQVEVFPIVQQAPRSHGDTRISYLFLVGILCRNGEVSELFGTGSQEGALEGLDVEDEFVTSP